LPAWSYSTKQVPVALVIVKVAPEFEHAPPLLNATGSAELLVAATVKLSLYVAFAGACVNTVIVWFVFATTTKKLALASAKRPFEAVTVKLKEPGVVGVPESRPAALRLRPGGRLPAVTANSPAGEPALELNVWLYATPTTAEAGGAGLGVEGAAPSCPDPLAPQQTRCPSVFIAQVWLPPALTALTVPSPAGTLA
jgi:hypothetical protein